MSDKELGTNILAFFVFLIGCVLIAELGPIGMAIDAFVFYFIWKEMD